MSIPFDAAEVLDREFLGVRACLLEVAASLDRLGRSPGDVHGDPRWSQICRAISLLDGKTDRTGQIQRIFSLDYDPQWKKNL